MSQINSQNNLLLLSINYDDGCYARDVAIVAYWSINSSIVKLSVIGCIILKHVPNWLI